MKKLLELVKGVWEKIKKWFKIAIGWLKNHILEIINFWVIFFAYGKVYQQPGFSGAEVILGIWLFTMIGYYVFWKLLGADKAVKDLIEQRKKNKIQ